MLNGNDIMDFHSLAEKCFHHSSAITAKSICLEGGGGGGGGGWKNFAQGGGCPSFICTTAIGFNQYTHYHTHSAVHIIEIQFSKKNTKNTKNLMDK